MAEAHTPTLEDLRDIPEPAWLWDAVRARIVWANAAGLGFFGCASLFDLVDRPFDFAEPGVERIDLLSIGDFRLLAASLFSWVGIGFVAVVAILGPTRRRA